LSEIPAGPGALEPGSFRDRTARVFYAGDAVYRGLTGPALAAWQRVSGTSFFQNAMTAGRVVGTSVETSAPFPELSRAHDWQAVLRHQRIPFVSYPYEWCFGMLKDAASLHLELLRAALDDGVTMKDGTPFNVQWIGASPVFIDIATFVPWQPGEPWAGYRQFCRSFLYPLMLQAYKGVPFQPWLRGRLDGIQAGEFRRLLTWRDIFRSGVATHVIAQSGLERQLGGTSHDLRSALRNAGFDKRIIVSLVERLQRLVAGLQWTAGTSTWSEYTTHNSYDAHAFTLKEAFVRHVIESRQHRLVWDIGCNTGHFAKIAASHADCVVAIDSDHESVERLYRDLRERRNSNILPLTMDLSDPSPAVGWRTRERRTLQERGTPDLVLCLALIHHLAISANVPIADILDWLVECGGDLVIEFPTEQDEMVKRLLLNKDQRYDDYRLPAFERALAARFDVQDRLELPSGTRYLYHATRRAQHEPRGTFAETALA
jgi:hypothetical protein